MSNLPNEPRAVRPAPTDSPWFWAMLFSAAALVVVVVIWPKYVRRQAGVELQYHAGKEITRRRAEHDAQARDPGQEGAAAPPAAGEVLVSLWPVAAVLLALLILSALMFRRGLRPTPLPAKNSPRAGGVP